MNISNYGACPGAGLAWLLRRHTLPLSSLVQVMDLDDWLPERAPVTPPQSSRSPRITNLILSSFGLQIPELHREEARLFLAIWRFALNYKHGEPSPHTQPFPSAGIADGGAQDVRRRCACRRRDIRVVGPGQVIPRQNRGRVRIALSGSIEARLRFRLNSMALPRSEIGYQRHSPWGILNISG